MKSILVTWQFNLAASLPLGILHRFGAILGWLMYLLDSKYAARLRENLGRVWEGRPEADFHKAIRANTMEMGKSIFELPWIWRRPLDEVLRKVQSVHGLEYLSAARERGQGIIVLTPHLGCLSLWACILHQRCQ